MPGAIGEFGSSRIEDRRFGACNYFSAMACGCSGSPTTEGSGFDPYGMPIFSKR